MKDYIPTIFEDVETVVPGSAWEGIPNILKDIITRFNLNTDSALEFGCDKGYSASALSKYFKKVRTVDTFRGDLNTLTVEQSIELCKEVAESLVPFGVEVVRSSYQDYTKRHYGSLYDLIHIDIIHTFEDTVDCGNWAVQHSNCVIFHDTISYPEVMKAVNILADVYNLDFYNYKESNGLGILIRQ